MAEQSLAELSLDSSISTHRTSTSSVSTLRRPVRRPSVGDSQVVEDNDKGSTISVPEQETVLQAGFQTVFQEAMACVVDGDGADFDDRGKLHATVELSNTSSIKNNSNREDKGIEKRNDTGKEDDDDVDDNESTSSDNSDKTEVTNNKSLAGTNADKRRSGCSKQLFDSFSMLSFSLDNSNHAPLKQHQEEEDETLPFKGNSSIKQRREKEKKKEERRRSKGKRKKNRSNVKKDDDIDFDLRSKPGFIHVVEELDEDADLLGDMVSHGTCPSRKSGKSRSTTKSGTSSGNQTSSSSSSSTFFLTKERIRSHMKDYYEDYDSIFRYGKSSKDCWQAFFNQYFTEDILWVRSTGNPIGQEGLAQLLADDIVGVSMAIVSIDSIQLLAGGLAAVVVFTADQEYVYKGAKESDRTVITTVLHVAKGCEILIGHEHRCVGKPIPKDTRWDS